MQPGRGAVQRSPLRTIQAGFAGAPGGRGALSAGSVLLPGPGERGPSGRRGESPPRTVMWPQEGLARLQLLSLPGGL